MTKKRSTIIFLLLLTAVALYFCFILATPFLSSIAWAMVIAVMFFPLHKRVGRDIHNPNAAYIAMYDIPKIDNFKRTFPELYSGRPVLASVR